MNIKSFQNRYLSFYVFVGLIIILHLFLRFTHIDRKVYWLDETFSSLRVSGYSEISMMEEVKNNYILKNSVIKSNNLLKYQEVNSDKNITDVIDSIQQKDPTHTPLYFILLRLWNILQGDSSVSVNRNLSAIFSVLFVILFFILSRQIFQDSLAGWIGAVLASSSPFFTLYAQETRFYSLFSVMVVLSCITFFNSLKYDKIIHWVSYIVLTLTCLYTSWLSLLLQFSHFLIVIIHENFKFNRRLIRFIFCSIAIVVCILPWSLNINWPEFYRQGSLGNKSSIVLTDKIIFLIQSTGQTLTRLLIDFKSYGLLPYGIIAFITTVLILYAFLFPFIDKNIKDVKDIKVGLYLIFLTLPTPLAFALRDIFSTSGLRSDLNRYFIISYVGILLALTYLFYRKIKPLFITKLSPENISETENFISLQRLPLQRSIGNSKIYLMCFFLIISLETISSVTIVNEITWYNKVDSQIPEVSEIINQYSHPLIIMHPLHVERLAIFSLIRYFKKPLDFILINDGSQVAYIPPGYDAYFLFSPPFYGAPDYTIPELLKHFQFDLKELIVYDGIPLFKFEAAQP